MIFFPLYWPELFFHPWSDVQNGCNSLYGWFGVTISQYLGHASARLVECRRSTKCSDTNTSKKQVCWVANLAPHSKEYMAFGIDGTQSLPHDCGFNCRAEVVDSEHLELADRPPERWSWHPFLSLSTSHSNVMPSFALQRVLGLRFLAWWLDTRSVAVTWKTSCVGEKPPNPAKQTAKQSYHSVLTVSFLTRFATNYISRPIFPIDSY